MFDGVGAEEAMQHGAVVAGAVVVEPESVHLSAGVAVGVVGDFVLGVFHDVAEGVCVGDALYDLPGLVGESDDGALADGDSWVC